MRRLNHQLFNCLFEVVIVASLFEQIWARSVSRAVRFLHPVFRNPGAVEAARTWRISLMWGGFFLVQPLLIAVERPMKVRRWRPMAGRAWTLAALATSSPLLVEPVLQLIEPTWGTPDKLLLPAVRVLGLVVFVNVFVSLGSLASIRGLIPPTKSLERTRAGHDKALVPKRSKQGG